MTEPVLIDTGPLYAILDRRDEHHRACVETLRSLEGPLLSCWPVITEAAWLLRGKPNELERLLRLVAAGKLKLLELGPDSAEWIAAFLSRYRDLPAQLADAALMHLAERERISTIFTLDRRDFSVYRTTGGTSLTLIPA